MYVMYYVVLLWYYFLRSDHDSCSLLLICITCVDINIVVESLLRDVPCPQWTTTHGDLNFRQCADLCGL